MKRVIVTILLIIAMLTLAACGGSREEPTATPEPEPTATPEPEPEPEEVEEEAPAEEAADEGNEEADDSAESEEAADEGGEEAADSAESEEAADESGEEAASDEGEEATDAAEDSEAAADEGGEEAADSAESEEATTDEGGEEAASDEGEEATDAAEDSEAAADEGGEEAAAEEGDDAEAPEALASADGADITILLNDLYFGETNNNLQEPPVWTVSSGQEYAIDLANQSPAVQHSWVVIQKDAEISVPYNEELDKDSVLFDSGLVDADASSTIAFTAPEEAGEYFVICTVPGHSAVMQGQLVVE